MSITEVDCLIEGFTECYPICRLPFLLVSNPKLKPASFMEVTHIPPPTPHPTVRQLETSRILLVIRRMQRLRFRSMPRYFVASRAIVALLALLFFGTALPLSAHDIPSDATVQMFFKPAGNHLNILVRVPLRTMRDLDFPERGQGYLDFDRVDATLREAA